MNKNENEQYLKLLSIFHYVVGGLAGLFACFPIIHFVVGLTMLFSGFTQSAEAAPFALVGILFTSIAGMIILFGWAFAICMILAGRYIAQRKKHMFCMVMAGVECMFTPFGTVLGVFTIILLSKPEIKALFDLDTNP